MKYNKAKQNRQQAGWTRYARLCFRRLAMLREDILRKSELLAFFTIMFFSNQTFGLEEIDTISSNPNKGLGEVSQEKAIDVIINNDKKSFVVHARDNDYSFQLYSSGDKVFVEIVLSYSKLSEGEPFFVDYGVPCPSNPGAVVEKSWPISEKLKSIEYFFEYTSYDFIDNCSVVYDQSKERISWLRSITWTSDKNLPEINRFLNDFAKIVLGYESGPYYYFAELAVPN